MRGISGILASRWSILVAVVVLLGLSFVFRAPLAHIQLPGERVFEIGEIGVTNTMLAAFLASVLLAWFALASTHNMRETPAGLQNAAEMAVEMLLGLVEGVAGPRLGRKFFPLVATIFLFIITCNYMGLLPGYGTIGVIEHGEEGTVLVPLLRSASTDLNTTVALALVAVIAVEYFGIRTLGAGTYLSRFINFSGPIEFFMGLLETISELSRVISLSFRLFGNVFAGEVLLTVIGFLIPFVAVLPFYGLELFVGAIQAFIFAILTLVFLTLATMGHGGEAHSQH
ncbi:MAG: F0F1 ATP synthase subunit A [Chloroflexi bacterium]|nr:F0F1 ATP synthase subunit A [Chloroflexota bacterium]MCL5107663.1 F0F1 ATP synthase subunit A [Chloroflexota bacterium]